MRMLLSAAAMVAMAAPVAAAADGQRAGGARWDGPTAGQPGSRPRWGGRVQGRWWGGWRAPGGWGAYRRPMRGWVLPSYWIAPRWYVTDWRGYGLPTPPAGYGWSRYYDDAVLIDSRGSVYDTIGGVDWDRVDPADTDYAYRDDAPTPPGAAYAVPPAPPPPPLPAPRDNGVGGAAIGAVVGGVAGNVIAGRGSRLGGTLVGAGIGAAAGYAIDRADDRGRRPRGYGADYPPPPPRRHGHRMPPPPPGYDGGYPPPPPPAAPPIVSVGPGATIVSSETRPTPGYYANGYYYPGTTITTITVQPQPAVTTREVWSDAPRRAWRKRAAAPTKLMRRK